jgi:ribosomal protein S18 acetylase RimI-like enzyme
MLQYREATVQDLAGICALGAEVNALHNAAWPDLFVAEIAPEKSQEVWRSSLGQAGATTFVAATDSALAGFVTVAIVDEASPLFRPMSYAKVGTVGVTEGFRGQGIGHALMTLVEDWAQSHGATEVHLNVWAFNEGARKLYEELGYAVRSHHMGKRLQGATCARESA